MIYKLDANDIHERKWPMYMTLNSHEQFAAVVTYMMMSGGVSKLLEKISNGCFGDSCERITSNPQHTPWGQKMVKIPGVSVGWLEEYFWQAS